MDSPVNCGRQCVGRRYPITRVDLNRLQLQAVGSRERGRLIRLRRPVLLAQIFPATISQQNHDFSSLHALRYAQSYVQNRAAGRAGEDPSLHTQLQRANPCLLARYQDSPIQHGLIENRWDKAVCEAAQALNAISLNRLSRDNLNSRIVLFQATANAGERAPGAKSRNQHIQIRQVAQNLWTSCFVMCSRISRVAVLKEHNIAPVLLNQLLCQTNRSITPGGSR